MPTQTDAPPKLNDRQTRLLQALCECQPGRGVVLGPEARRVAAPLIRQGLVWSMKSILTVHIATDAGRALFSREPSHAADT